MDVGVVIINGPPKKVILEMMDLNDIISDPSDEGVILRHSVALFYCKGLNIYIIGWLILWSVYVCLRGYK